MTRQRPTSGKSELFDWDREPVDEPASTFFHSTGFSTLSAALDAPPRTNRAGYLLLIGAVVLGFGIVVVLATR